MLQTLLANSGGEAQAERTLILQAVINTDWGQIRKDLEERTQVGHART